MPANVEDDFLAAFYRLSAGAPLNKKLKARIDAGKVVAVNQNTVALEAGHSRTLLSQRAKGYDRICALLFPDEFVGDRIKHADKEVSSTPKQRETLGQKVERLTEVIGTLSEERDMFATRAAEAYQAIALLKRDILSLQREIGRRQKNLEQFTDMYD